MVVFLFLLFNFIFSIFSNGKTVNYSIDDNNVLEQYIKEDNSYYFEVTSNKKIFNFKVDNNFDENSYIINKIYSFENDLYVCIFPIFEDNNIETDILCLRDNMIYPYRSIMNKNLELDKFAHEMEEYGYLIDNNNEKFTTSSNLKIFNGNLNGVIVIPSYRGIYIIDSSNKKNFSSIDLFDKDIYSHPIQTIVSDYYLVADYNESYSFHEFYLVNLKSTKVSIIASDDAISHNSYIQGVVDNCVYLIDRSNKKQYKIDVSNKIVTLLGNKKKGIMYYDNGKFINRTIYDALNENLIFNYNSIESDKYDYVYNNNGVYYSYLKVKNGYDMYISYEQNTNIYTYALNVDSFEDIYYSDDSIYYVDGDNLFNYSLANGKLKVLNYSELMYNENLTFFVYEK